MNNSEKRFSCAKGWRISTPSFPDTPPMDSFYMDAHGALEARFTELHESGERGIFVADYFIRSEKDTIEVTLRLRRRTDGKYTDEQSFSHRWRGQVIVPKHSRLPFCAWINSIIPKKASIYKRKSKSAK